jgi:hypothetical protein
LAGTSREEERTTKKYGVIPVIVGAACSRDVLFPREGEDEPEGAKKIFS